MKPPPGARSVSCRDCGTPIWFGEWRGRTLPLEVETRTNQDGYLPRIEFDGDQPIDPRGRLWHLDYYRRGETATHRIHTHRTS